MTSKKKQLTGIVLAAMMVLSVLAIAPVAAQEAEASLTADSSAETVAPGDEFDVTFTLENTGDDEGTNTGVDITDFPSDWDVTSDSDDWLDGQDAWLSFDTLGSGDTFEVTATFTVPESADDGDYDISADGEVSTESSASTSVTVTVDGDDDGGEEDPEPPEGDAPDADVHYDAQDDDLDERDVWSGQTVAIESFSSAVYVYEGVAEDASDDDERVEILRPEDGWIVLDASDLDDGPHYLVETSSDDTYGTFWVDDQDLDVEFEHGTAYQSAGTTLEVESNRDDEAFDAIVSVDGLDNEDATDLFEGATYLEDDDLIYIPGVEDGDELSVDFSELDVELSDYTFTMTVVDTGVSASAEISVEEPDDFDAQFAGTGVFQEDRGDTAMISLDVDRASEVVVHVGSEDINYLTKLTISDIDSSESVDIMMNTFQAGHADADSVFNLYDPDNNHGSLEAERLTDEFSNDDTRLENERYRLNASIPAIDQETDLGTLILNERSTGDATTYTVNGDVDVSDTEEFFESDMSESSDVSLGDYLVVEVDVSGIYGYYGDDFDGITLAGLHQNPGAHEDPRNIGPAETHLDAANDKLYAVFDPAEQNLEDGDEYLGYFALGADNPYIPDEDSIEEAAAAFSVNAPSVSIDDPAVESGDEQVVSGTSNLAPGNYVRVEVESLDDDHPFLKPGTAIVGENGDWSVELDFSDDPAGTPFLVTLPDYDDIETEGEIGASTADLETSVDAPAEVTLGEDFLPTVAIDNIGDETKNVTATLTFDGEQTDEHSEEIAAGESGSIELHAATKGLEAGDYDWSIDVDGQTHEGTVSVVDTEGASFDFTVDAPGKVEVKDVAGITLVITNTGDEAGSASYDITVDGETTSDSVEIQPGEEMEVSESVDTSAAGDYSWEVTVDGESESGSFTVEAPEDKDGDDGSSDDGSSDDGSSDDGSSDDGSSDDGDDGDDSSSDDGDDGDDEQPGFGVAVAIVALLAAAMLALRRD